MYRLFLCLAFVLICACGCSNKEDSEKEKAASEITAPAAGCGRQGMAASSQAAQAEQRQSAPGPDELDRADRMIAYNNRVNEELDNGFYSLGNTFYGNSRRYIQIWQLPVRPKTRKRADLTPEKGLFDEAEAALITDGLRRMDKALDNLLGHYADLEKYAADDRIRDDGKLGQKLAAQIKNDHASFIAARDSWLGTVRKRAAEAEEIALYHDPLQRQIMAANMILNQLREVNNILASGSPEPDLLRACCQNIVTAVDDGGHPPFPARPAQERLYRAFLKSAGAYRDLLEMAANEGFHPTQLRQIQDAARACAAAWNEFVKETNSRAHK